MALNGTDCEADTGISNSKCISYVKSWINSEYDSMHIHIKLKSQPEPRFRAVFFGSFSSIRPWFEIVWIPPSFYCAKWRNFIWILFWSILKIQDSSLNHFISHFWGWGGGLGYGICFSKITLSSASGSHGSVENWKMNRNVSELKN